MHNAPSVIFPVGRCRFHVIFVSAVSLAGLGMLLLWCKLAGDSSVIYRWAGWVGAALWSAWGMWAFLDWGRSTRGQLEWDALAPSVSMHPADGQGAWHWHKMGGSETTRLVGVELTIDLQILALLRLQDTARGFRWAWVERWRDPARWADLRRAFYSTPH